MKKAALGLITVVLASSALAGRLQHRTFPVAVAKDTLIADARGIDDPSQPSPR
jgi:hypothetical protein